MAGVMINTLPDAGNVEDNDFMLIEQRTGTKKIKMIEVNKKANEAITSLDTKVTKNDTDTKKSISGISSQLADKASKDDVARLSSGTPLFASNVSVMTDKTKNYVNTTDGFLYRYNGTIFEKTTVLYQSTGINDKSITPLKTTFIDTIESKNLFNHDVALAGKIMDSGNIYTNVNWVVSGFIKIPASKIVSIFYKYTLNQPLFLFDSSKNYLGKIDMIGNDNKFTYTVNDSNAVYFRFNARIEFYITDTMAVEGSVVPSYYIPYSVLNKVNSEIVIPSSIIEGGCVTKSNIGSEIDNFLSTSKSINLFNKYSKYNIDNKVLDNGNQYDNPNYFISHKIAIPNSKIITIDFYKTNIIPVISIFDKNEKYLTQVTKTVSNRYHTFDLNLLGSNAYYFKFNGYKNSDYFLNKDNLMVVEGSMSPEFYVPYVRAISNEFDVLKPYLNKTILFMGDSITASNYESRWVYWFNKKAIPSSFVNIAVPGAWWENKIDTTMNGNPDADDKDNTIPNQVQKVINENYPIFDVIFISAGTNNVTAGINDDIETSFTNTNNSYIDIETLDLTKTINAMRWTVEQLQNKYPKAQIFLCTPIQSSENIRTYKNIKAKGDKIKEVASRMSINIIDGINCGIYGRYEIKDAQGKYLADGLHPNMEGAKVQGEYYFVKYATSYSRS